MGQKTLAFIAFVKEIGKQIVVALIVVGIITLGSLVPTTRPYLLKLFSYWKEIVLLVLLFLIIYLFHENKKLSKSYNLLNKKIDDFQKLPLAETITKKLIKEFKEKNEQLRKSLAIDIQKHEEEITILRAEIYRTLGQYWESQNQYSTAFIWWMRAAEQFVLARDKNLARISLGAAKQNVERVQYATQLDYSLIGEYQGIFSKIPNEIYKIEKDLLEKAIKIVLEKRPGI